jgi:hypothetical protein
MAASCCFLALALPADLAAAAFVPAPAPPPPGCSSNESQMASSSVDEKDGWPARRLGLSRAGAGAGAHLSIV